VPSTTDDLRHAWRAVDRAWNDACFHISANARAVFERDHWLPLEKELAGTARTMDELAEVVARIIRELA
jgi:hypothetical protein